jgi:hypothetical protein
MDILGLIVGALIGTLLMTALMESAQAAHLTRMSIPFLLGSVVSERRATIRVVGSAMHLANGVIFAFAYLLLFEALGRSEIWLGALAGFLHGCLALMILLPVLQDVHPRMASDERGPDPTPMLQPPGFLARNYGRGTPLVTLLGHVLYGAVVAAFYDPFI